MARKQQCVNGEFEQKRLCLCGFTAQKWLVTENCCNLATVFGKPPPVGLDQSLVMIALAN
jgi:hypothetical protein